MKMLKTNYQYRRNKEYDRTVSTGEYARLRCFSKKALKKRHPDGAYEVVGAVGSDLMNPAGQYMYGIESGFYYNVKQSGMRYRTLGYIEVEEGQYFAVMKKSKRLPALLALLLVLIGTSAYFYLFTGKNSLIDRSAVNYEPPEHLNVEGSDGAIAIPGYRQIYVEAGTGYASAVLWNPPGNPCYFKYILKAEDEAVLFESGLIPPGKAVTEIELSREIPVGEQELTMEIQTFSLEDMETPLNGGVIKCSLIGIEP